MGPPDESETSGRANQGKVARLLAEYDLEPLGPELERLWTADEDRRSLRELADHFNQRLLERALEAANVRQLDGEVENTYRLLTSDDVSGADRTRVRRRLEAEGIDVDSLLDDFVTYQAIRTYLKKHRNAEYSPEEADPLEREAANAERLNGRTVSVMEGKLERLRDNDELTLGEFRTLATVQVVCEDCNSRFEVVELLERGGCDCRE